MKIIYLKWISIVMLLSQCKKIETINSIEGKYRCTKKYEIQTYMPNSTVSFDTIFEFEIEKKNDSIFFIKDSIFNTLCDNNFNAIITKDKFESIDYPGPFKGKIDSNKLEYIKEIADLHQNETITCNCLKIN